MSWSPWTAPGEPDSPVPKAAGTPATGFGIELAVADDAHLAETFRYQNAAVGKEGHADGIFQFARNGDDADTHAFGGVELHGQLGQRLMSEALGSDGNVEFRVEGNVLLAEAGLGNERG